MNHIIPASGPGDAAESALRGAFSIGDIKVSPPAVLAPMAGITSWPLRMLCRNHGAPLCVTEMIAAPAIARNRFPRDVLNALKTHPMDRPLVYQIFGSDPGEMAEAARILAAMEADAIDVNMGCPVKKIVKNGSGAALMKDPNRVKKIVAAVRKAIAVPLTVKTRTGWDDQSKNAVELARICEGEGADAVTIHGRTRARGFAGEADLSAIREVVQAVKIPVIGNGGIDSLDDARNMMEKTGCAGVMIARSVRGNPWIFDELVHGKDHPQANPKVRDKAQAVLLQYDWTKQMMGDKRAVVEMRKHLSWYSKGLPRAVELRRTLQRLDDPDELPRLVKEYFVEPEEDRVQ